MPFSMELNVTLAGPGLTTVLSTPRKKKPSNNSRQSLAKASHQAWLEERGLSPSQIKAKQVAPVNQIPTYRTENKYTLSNTFEKITQKTGIMEAIHQESPEVQSKIIEKASRVMSLFNKGGLQYCTDGEDLTQVGTKSRR